MNKYLYYGVCVAMLLASCTRAGSHNHESEEHKEDKSQQDHANEITMSHEMIEAAGIVTEKVQTGTFAEVLKTSGQILAAQGEEKTVVAPTAGVVRFIRSMAEGSRVNAADKVISISSEHLMDGSQAERARIAFERAKEDFGRAFDLGKKQIVSKKELASVKERYENAKLSYEALSLGGDGKQVVIKSPLKGYVKTCMVNEGDYVSVGQPLLVVSQNKRLRLKADVSERYYSFLDQITSANFKTTYSDRACSLELMGGKRLAAGKSVDVQSHYIPVTFEFNNTGNIIPGSYVEVYLLGDERKEVISLPKSAITEEQGLNFVYVKVDDHCFMRREVRLGLSDGRRYEILSGIAPGDEVVTEGALHVKLASASHTIPGHTHNH